jgi:hypothetical protein
VLALLGEFGYCQNQALEILMHIELATCAGEDAPFDVSEEPSHERMFRHSPELNRLLRDHGVVVVNAEYRGMGGRGGFDSLRFTTADGADRLVFDGPRNLQLKAMFRALLLARHPDWCHGKGSCGQFRWDIRRDSVTHCHWAQVRGLEATIVHGI